MKLKKRKDGNNFLLEINKRDEIVKFINIVKPFVKEIPCMHYKINLKERFKNKRTKLLKEGYKNINDLTEIVLKNEYSLEDENFIINSKLTGITDK